MVEEKSNGHIKRMQGNPGLEDSRVQARPEAPIDSLIEVTEWLANWKGVLKEDDLAPRTIKWYERDVTAFLAWMQETTGSLRATYVDVAGYRDYLLEKGRSTATVNRALASANRFMSWAIGLGLAQDIGRAKAIREVASARPSLSRAETIRLMNRLDRSASPRDKAVVMMALGAGLRAGEISALRVRDCQFTAQRVELTVRAGKGRVSRRVRGGERTRAAVEARMAEIESALTDGSAHRRDRYTAHDSVLTRAIAAYDPADETDPYERIKDEPLVGVQANWIGRIVTGAGKMAGLEGLHPHMLRRTYGQIRRASGASIEVVAREMGHASIDTTVRYTMPIGDTWDVVESSFL